MNIDSVVKDYYLNENLDYVLLIPSTLSSSENVKQKCRHWFANSLD